MSLPDGFVVGCGQCPVVGFVNKCLEYETTGGEGCFNCRDWIFDYHRAKHFLNGETWSELLSDRMGWCGCGQPDEPDRMMLAYLRARSHDGFPKPPAGGVSGDAETILAYIADNLGLTEHGGGVGGAWITDEGKRAIASLERWTGNLNQPSVLPDNYQGNGTGDPDPHQPTKGQR